MTDNIKLYEEIVEHIRNQKVENAEIGLLVEFPHSGHRQKTSGMLLSKRGRHLGEERYVKKVSIVLLIKKPRAKSPHFQAVEIRWKGCWWWGWFREKNCANCQFFDMKQKIQVYELSKDGEYTGGRISNYYVLNLSEYKFSIRALMRSLKSLEKRLKKDSIPVKNLKFLATCDDLKWLNRVNPKYIRKMLKQQIKFQKNNEIIRKIIGTEREINSLKYKLESREDDLLEAKDRLHPNLSKLWSLLGWPIVWEIWGVFKLIIAFFVVGFALGISDYFGNKVDLDTPILIGGLLLLSLVIKPFRYYRTLSRWTDHLFLRQGRIERSRVRQTEEHYRNYKKT